MQINKRGFILQIYFNFLILTERLILSQSFNDEKFKSRTQTF